MCMIAFMQPKTPTPSTLPARAAVAVVGAGYSGLAAALALVESGVDVIVLEAADRVGGRILSERLPDGTVIDHGGQWIGPTQTRLAEFAARFGVATFPTFNSGQHVEIWSDSVRRTFRGAGPKGAAGVDEYIAAADEIDRIAATVDLDDPSLTPDAAALDSETCQSFWERTVPDAAARDRLAMAVQGVLTVEPRDLSVLHLAFYVASAGSFDQLMETEGYAQDSRFHDGAQETSLRMAAELGHRVHLDAAVRRISHSDDSVTIETDRGDIEVERVIIATPPTATVGIDVRPRLPLAHNRFIEKSPMGDVAKIHLVYPTPFWRERGLSGEVIVYGEPSVGVVFDNSPADAARGVLVCFVYADRLHRWSRLSEEERRAEVLAVCVDAFGADAAEPITYTERIWSNDEFVGGGYAATPTPGTWIEHGTHGWRAPVGRLHFAGTERASVWNGYIEGAIRSGERAAAEILAL